MVLIVILAVVSMTATVVMTDMLKGEAASINIAGSLRMQAYRIATVLLEAREDKVGQKAVIRARQNFEWRMTDPQLLAVIPRSRGPKVGSAYRRVVRQWRQDIKPLLESCGDKQGIGKACAPALAYVRAVGPFVANINGLVKALEDDAESKVDLLKLLIGVALFLTIGLAYVAVYTVYTDVLVPLGNLLRCARAAARQDFSIRAEHVGPDELGELGQAFNVMAMELSARYRDLEVRVQEKTTEIERRNRSLELLYRTTARLSEGPLSDSCLTLILRDLHEHIDTCRGGAICIAEEAGRAMFTLATTMELYKSRPAICGADDCDACKTCERATIRERHDIKGKLIRTLSVPLTDQDRRYGVLTVSLDIHRTDNWFIPLFETIGRHIGSAISTTQRRARDRRLLLYEERAVIARELHDSLAQSLCYLKIQVSRLQRSMDISDRGDTAIIIQELREGLTSAYRELRELLTTFRLKMDGRGLEPAIIQTIDEFQHRGALSISLRYELQTGTLSVNQEIHVLQVIREALSNVVHHALATQAWISIRIEDDGDVFVAIEDNGVGMGATTECAHHYGLAIIQERAHTLGGPVKWEEGRFGGTRVELRFRPATSLVTGTRKQEK